MIALIRALGPAVALVIGLAGGGVLSGGLGWAFTHFIHDPALVRDTQRTDELQCTIRTQAAAAAATQAERVRRDAAIEAAMAAYVRAKAAEDAAQQQLIDQQAQENASYEQALADAGRSCPPFDDADFSRLRQ